MALTDHDMLRKEYDELAAQLADITTRMDEIKSEFRDTGTGDYPTKFGAVTVGAEPRALDEDRFLASLSSDDDRDRVMVKKIDSTVAKRLFPRQHDAAMVPKKNKDGSASLRSVTFK